MFLLFSLVDKIIPSFQWRLHFNFSFHTIFFHHPWKLWLLEWLYSEISVPCTGYNYCYICRHMHMSMVGTQKKCYWIYKLNDIFFLVFSFSPFLFVFLFLKEFHLSILLTHYWSIYILVFHSSFKGISHEHIWT